MEDNSTPQATPVAEDVSVDTPETAELEQADIQAEGSSTPEPQQTAEQKKQAAEVKKALKALEIKVNGKSKTVEIDPDNEDELKKYVQKAMASDEKFQEAALYRKQAEQLVELLQKDPVAVLRNPALGLDIRKLAEQIILQDMEEQEKTPEQKELEEARRKLKEYEENKKAQEEAYKREMFQKLVQEQQQVTENNIIKALETSNLPESPYVVRRIADIMVSAVEAGWEDVQIDQIMPYAEEVILDELQKVFNKHNTPEKLEKIVGKDVLNNYRKTRIAKLKSAPKTPSQLTESTAKTDGDKEKKEEPKKIKLSDSIW